SGGRKSAAQTVCPRGTDVRRARSARKRSLKFWLALGDIARRARAALTGGAEPARGEEALRESEQRYERAMPAAEAGFWDWDVPADRFHVSPKLVEMAGMAPETKFAARADFMSRAGFYPEDRLKWEQVVKELFASDKSRVAMELRHIRDGETRWVHLSGLC